MTGRYVRFDGMTWPRTDTDVGWQLRYGKPSQETLLVAASMVEAYKHLIDMPQRRRNRRVSQIRAALDEGKS